MKRISTLEIDAAFERVWEYWPNKDYKHASEKAFEICIKQGAELHLLELACKIYAHENIGKEFTHQLRNFLLQNVWKDMVEGFEDAESYGKTLEARRREAKEVCETWNQRRKSFWCECLDIESRIPLAYQALKNPYFKSHWKKALDKLREIFTIKPTENDKFRNITFSIQWFCDTSPNKHTVLKIMEGQFGYPSKQKKEKPIQELDKSTFKETRKLFKEVFGYDPKPLPKKKINNNSQPVKTIVEYVTRSFELPETNKSEEEGDVGIY